MPQWLLYRLARRGLNVLDRHKETEPAIAVFEQLLGVSAPAFLDAYARLEALASTRAVVMAGRNDAMDVLYRKLRGWVVVLAVDLPNFDRSKYADNPTVPEDLINDTEGVFAVLARHEQAGNELPFYAEELETDLEAALIAVREELKATGGTSAEHAALLAEVRQTGDVFQQHLIAFRRVLSAHVGRNHPDYQRLRVTRSRRLAVEEEEGEETPENPELTGDAAVSSELAEDEGGELDVAS